MIDTKLEIIQSQIKVAAKTCRIDLWGDEMTAACVQEYCKRHRKKPKTKEFKAFYKQEAPPIDKLIKRFMKKSKNRWIAYKAIYALGAQMNWNMSKKPL
jgi:hypothetical protein